MKKRVRIIDNNSSIYLDEIIPNLKFLEAEEEDVETVVNSQETKGVDGIMIGPSTFGPFKLVLRFSYKGSDIEDYRLVKSKIRNLIYKRHPYYITHSDIPGKKYAVYCESNAISDLTSVFGTFEITFNVYKGYSESLKETDEFNLSNDTWQFGNGLVIDDDIKYTHTENKFKIFNGSSDTINPLLRHKFNLKINIDAPKGFKLTNKTTGDVFEYTQPIQKDKTLNIIGLHPFIDKQRVGVNTNWQWITLDPGYNDIEITGESIENITTKWIFPFIYR